MKCSCVQYRKNKDGIGYTAYPCGQCIACRLNKVRDWTIRLMHEKKMHDKAVFLTLTYAPEFLPENGTLVKEDLQLFIKRLRKHVGKVRFFACGEYGEKYSRPHYHLIIFGLGAENSVFNGKKYDYKKHGYWLNSPLWKFGTMFIGDVSYGSCRYVASYVNKKLLGKDAARTYADMGKIPEFTLMSRRPGIGADFLQSIKRCTNIKNVSSFEEKKQPCPGIMKIRSSIQKNSKSFVKLRKGHIPQSRIVTRKLGSVKLIIVLDCL